MGVVFFFTAAAHYRRRLVGTAGRRGNRIFVFVTGRIRASGNRKKGKCQQSKH
jgi:hypothetical protein